jgi:hypothetical protein
LISFWSENVVRGAQFSEPVFSGWRSSRLFSN